MNTTLKNESQPRVSIIIPTYNRFETTLRAVESALNQTYKNIEIIVVDDCSTDDSFSRFKKALAPEIVLIQNPENSGAASGRNLGVDQSTGEFVAFLDSDDIWLPTKLEEQYSLFLKHNNCNVLIYSPAELEYKVNDSFINPSRPLKPGERVENYIFLHKQDIQTSGWFLRKDLFQRVRFTHKLKRHQDWDFILRAQEKGLVFVMTENILYMRGVGDKNQHVGTVKMDGVTEAWLLNIRKIVPIKTYQKCVVGALYDKYLQVQPLKTFPILLEASLHGCFYPRKFKYSIFRLLGLK